MAVAKPIQIETNTSAEITLTTPRKQGITIEVNGGGGGEPYPGPYEVTPTRETQVLRTAQKMAQRNIVVNPIPHDWGHITWDGSVLTVS